MALTGILFRRDTKAALELDPPLTGEVVFATDTLQYGAVVAGELIWRDVFTGPAIFRVDLYEDMIALAPVRENDFCYVEEKNKIYNFFNNNWTAITEIDDINVLEDKTWSSEKISTYKIDGNNRIISIKNSETAGIYPLSSSLNNGELFINVFDGKIFFKKDNGSVSLVEITNAKNINFDKTYFDSNLNKTIDSGLTSTTTQSAIYELSSIKAPKVNAILTTPNIGVATGTSFNGLTGLSTTLPVENSTDGSIGISTLAARADHSHPGDPLKAPADRPVFQIYAKAPYFWSTATTGDAPLVVNSTTKVVNLNSDLLDGQSGSFYTNATNMNAGILSSMYGGTGIAGTITGILYANGTSASTLATSAQILSQVSGSKTGSGVFALSDSPTFTTLINVPKIMNDVWCINSFSATSNTIDVINIELNDSSIIAGGEIQIVVTEDVKKHYTKLVFVYDGTNIYLNEESQITSAGDLATFDLSVSNNKLYLNITPANATAKTYRIKTSCMKN